MSPEGGEDMKMGAVEHRIDVCPSTNDIARELARRGAIHGTVVIAEEQTRGRGTKGRSWHSPRGLGLYVTFILRFSRALPAPAALPLLPLAAGLGTAEAVHLAAGAEVDLKWPNDLIWQKRKLGGILAESVFLGDAAEYALVGVGVNLNHQEEDFPETLRPHSTSIRLITGRPQDRDRLLKCLCQTFGSWYNSLYQGRRREVIRAFEKRMTFSTGDGIVMTTEDGRIPCFYKRLDEDGRLVIERNGNTLSFSFEEIRALDRA